MDEKRVEAAAKAIQALKDKRGAISSYEAAMVAIPAADAVQDRPCVHEWESTGRVDTGHNPVHREWACSRCDRREWGDDDGPFRDAVQEDERRSESTKRRLLDERENVREAHAHATRPKRPGAPGFRHGGRTSDGGEARVTELVREIEHKNREIEASDEAVVFWRGRSERVTELEAALRDTRPYLTAWDAHTPHALVGKIDRLLSAAGEKEDRPGDWERAAGAEAERGDALEARVTELEAAGRALVMKVLEGKVLTRRDFDPLVAALSAAGEAGEPDPERPFHPCACGGDHLTVDHPAEPARPGVSSRSAGEAGEGRS